MLVFKHSDGIYIKHINVGTINIIGYDFMTKAIIYQRWAPLWI